MRERKVTAKYLASLSKVERYPFGYALGTYDKPQLIAWLKGTLDNARCLSVATIR